MREKQVPKEHYRFERYSSPARWGSYFWQVKLVTELEPETVLEIGVGDAVFGRYLEDVVHTTYTGVDIDPDLHPDVVGDITALSFPDNSFDVVCAFEILEHLPFDVVPKAMSELRRVSKNHVVVSVPDRRPYIQFLCKIPLLPRLRFLLKTPFSRKGSYGKQHFWEIGWDAFSLRSVQDLLTKDFSLENHFVPFENPQHHFFILKK